MVLSFALGSAQAATLTVTGLGQGQTLPIIAAGMAENGWAGEIAVSVDGAPMKLYCVDLFTNIGYASYQSTITLASAEAAYQRAAWLYVTYAGAVANSIQGAALQLALWDVVHDGGNGLNLGSVILAANASGNVRTLAESYISSSSGQTSGNALIYRNISLASGMPAQTLMGAAAANLATPEPSAIVLIGFGAGAMAMARKRWMANQGVRPSL